MIPQGESLSLPLIRARLIEENILLNVVVQADLRLATEPGLTVLGVDAGGQSYILEAAGEFSTSRERAEITMVR